MTTTFSCLELETTASLLPASCESRILNGFLKDSLRVTQPNLLGHRLSTQIVKNEQIHFVLRDEDRDHFLKTLKNPPPPNQKLKDLFDNYYEMKMKDS